MTYELRTDYVRNMAKETDHNICSILAFSLGHRIQWNPEMFLEMDICVFEVGKGDMY